MKKPEKTEKTVSMFDGICNEAFHRCLAFFLDKIEKTYHPCAGRYLF